MHNAAALLPPLLNPDQTPGLCWNAGWSHALHLGPPWLRSPPPDFMCNFMVFEAYSLSAVYLTPCAL